MLSVPKIGTPVAVVSIEAAAPITVTFLLSCALCIVCSPINVTRSDALSRSNNGTSTVGSNDTKILPRQPQYPGLNDFLPTMPSLTGGSTPATPTLTPADFMTDLYAFCFTIFYGARKCCIGIIIPFGPITCEPNERKRKKNKEDF